MLSYYLVYEIDSRRSFVADFVQCRQLSVTFCQVNATGQISLLRTIEYK